MPNAGHVDFCAYCGEPRPMHYTHCGRQACADKAEKSGAGAFRWPTCVACQRRLPKEHVFLEGCDVYGPEVRVIPAGPYHLECLQGALVPLVREEGD